MLSSHLAAYSSQMSGGGGGGGSGKYSLMGGRRGEVEEVGDYVGQGGGEIVSPPYRAALSRSTSLKVSGSCD